MTSTQPGKRFWAVISANRRVPGTVDFSAITLQARDNFQIVFTRDADDDGLLEREETFYGSSDNSKDSDGDGISDFAEVRSGWIVTVKGKDARHVFSNPAAIDTDLDGLSDDLELQYGTDPTQADTDFDALSDRIEISGTMTYIPFSTEVRRSKPVTVTRYGPEMTPADLVAHDQVYVTNPLDPDTDDDSVTDGREIFLGINPNDSTDAKLVIDDDDDGLSNHEEEEGWVVTAKSEKQSEPATRPVRSDQLRADADRDGLPDVYEKAIGTDPYNRDTDGDLLSDYREFDPDNSDQLYDENDLADARIRCADAADCRYDKPEEKERTLTDPLNWDTDGDGISDYLELRKGSGTDATSPDSDGDGLDDNQEKKHGTDPNNSDTDGDGTLDGAEVGIGTDPRTPDKMLRLRFDNLKIIEADDEGLDNWIELCYLLTVADQPGQPDDEVHKIGDVGDCKDYRVVNTGQTMHIGKDRTYILGEKDSITIKVIANEFDDTSSNDPFAEGEVEKTFMYTGIESLEEFEMQQKGYGGTIATTGVAQWIQSAADLAELENSR